MGMVEEWQDSIAHPTEIYWSPVPPLLWPEIRGLGFGIPVPWTARKLML